MKISEALERYLVQLTADGRSPHTVNQAKRHVRLMAATVGDLDVATTKPEDVARFLASDVVAKGRLPSSANALRSSLRCFFAFAHAAGYVSTNPARLVRRARYGPSRPRAISGADAEKLVSTIAQSSSALALRDRVMVEAMLRAGVRVGSLVGLDVEDLDGDQLRLRRLKGGGTDVVYLPEVAAALLRSHVAGRARGPMFEGASGTRLSTRHVARRLEYWARRARIGSTHPHALRHAFGMAVFARTQDVLLTSAALSHRSLSSTSIYARPSEVQVRRAVCG